MNMLRCNNLSGLECFLHPRTDEDHDGKKVLPFNPTSLNKCQEALLVRKECHLKYENCTLPSDCNTRLGYHMECYRKFTALGRIHHPNAYSFSESLPVTENRSTRSSSTNDTNRIGIYGTKCIICDQERKKVSGKEQRLVLVLTENMQNTFKLALL